MIKEAQFQMSNQFAEKVFRFMKNNKIDINELSKIVNINKYMLYKVINRKIKMCCPLSLLTKIARPLKIYGIRLGSQQPTIVIRNSKKYEIYQPNA